MTQKHIQQTETTETLEALVNTIQDGLAALWHDADGNPHRQLHIRIISEKVAELGNYADGKELLLKSAHAALVEMETQRDEAVDEAKWQQEMKEKVRISSPIEYRKKLAQKIAYATGMPVPDAVLVIELLEEQISTFEEYSLNELLNLIKELGNNLAIERGLREDEDEA